MVNDVISTSKKIDKQELARRNNLLKHYKEQFKHTMHENSVVVRQETQLPMKAVFPYVNPNTRLAIFWIDNVITGHLIEKPTTIKLLKGSAAVAVDGKIHVLNISNCSRCFCEVLTVTARQTLKIEAKESGVNYAVLVISEE